MRPSTRLSGTVGVRRTALIVFARLGFIVPRRLIDEIARVAPGLHASALRQPDTAASGARVGAPSDLDEATEIAQIGGAFRAGVPSGAGIEKGGRSEGDG